jgi:hypothetical protein
MEKIKQPQGGCPAINNATNKVFKGHTHTITKEEEARWFVKSLEFWKSRGFDYETLKIKP